MTHARGGGVGRVLTLGIGGALAGLFFVAPLAVMLLLSFTNKTYFRFPPDGFSLRWYTAVFSDGS